MRFPPRGGSTTDLIDLAYLEDGVARLRDGRSRVGLELTALNLLLRSGAERQMVWRRYWRALSTLSAPVSLYAISRPLAPSKEATATANGRLDAEYSAALLTSGLVHRRNHLAVIWDDSPVSLRGALPGHLGRVTTLDLDQRRRAVAAALAGPGLRPRPLEDGNWLHLLQELTGGRSGWPTASFASWLAPETATVRPDRLELSDRVARSLVVRGFPRRLQLGWMAPLVLAAPGPLRMAQHLYPVPKVHSLNHLRRRIRTFEAGLEVDRRQGRRPDAGTRAALEDALALEEMVLLEEDHLLRLVTCVTVEGSSSAEMEMGWEQVVNTLTELGCTPVPLFNRQVDGWRATLPLGVDPLGWSRDMTAAATATALPFLRATLDVTNGVLLGPSPSSKELVTVDPLASSNPNRNILVLGTSGGGKSFTSKLLAARLFLRGSRLRCLDPAGEYLQLGALLGARCLDLGATGERGLNVLGPPGQEPEGRVERALPLLRRLLGGGRSPASRASLEAIGLAALAALRLHPSEAGLSEVLEQLEGAGEGELAAKLRRQASGPGAGVFQGAGGLEADDALVVSLRHLHAREELLGAAMELVLWHLEADLEHRHSRPTLVAVDEAEVLLSSPSGARFLESMARRIRKLGAGLLVVSQVVEDFLNSPVGNVVIRNCHTKLLLRQEPVALPGVRRAFSLSEAECELLRDAEPGCGLVLAGDEHASFRGGAPQAWWPALTTGQLAEGSP
jgi:hypothetical protein